MLFRVFSCAYFKNMKMRKEILSLSPGPYAQKLMGMDFDLATRYEQLLLEDQRLDRTHLRRYREYSQNEILRPGKVF